MIILAPFFKDLQPSKEGTELLEMSKVFDYKLNLSRLEHTFMMENSHHKFEVCSDEQTKLSTKNVFRSKLTDKNIMESFCISNLEYVKLRNDKIILCGADHLINGKLDKLFDDDFDIGLAIAKKPLRVNNTIVLVNNKNKELVVKFFERRLAEYYALPEAEKLWYGDQLSYQRIIEKEGIFDSSLSNPPIGIFEACGLKIKLFPYGSEYVSPLKKNLFPEPSMPVIIDFKGPKRKLRTTEVYNNLISK